MFKSPIPPKIFGAAQIAQTNFLFSFAKVTKIGVEDIETANVTAEAGKEIELPKTVNVTYNTEKVEENVVWSTDGIDFSKAGTYTVEGTVKFSRKIERGAYKDKTSGTTKCTVVIKQKNLITEADDAGFEKADNFTVLLNLRCLIFCFCASRFLHCTSLT